MNGLKVVIVLGVITLTLSKCVSNLDCDINIFSKAQSNPLIDSILTISPTSYETGGQLFCGYANYLAFWEHNPSPLGYHPQWVINGSILEYSDSIFWKTSLGESMTYLFSINDTAGSNKLIRLDYENIDYSDSSNKLLDTSYYKLCIQDIFLEKKDSCKIFKIRIYNYPYFSFYSEGNDLILFLSIDYGFTGAYLCFNRSSTCTLPTRDTIFSFGGNIYMSRYDSTMIYIEPPGNYE